MLQVKIAVEVDSEMTVSLAKLATRLATHMGFRIFRRNCGSSTMFGSAIGRRIGRPSQVGLPPTPVEPPRGCRRTTIRLWRKRINPGSRDGAWSRAWRWFHD